MDAVRLHVLVVQEDPDSAQNTAILLHLAGHQVRFATTGSDAVEMVHQQWPDVVLVDTEMRGSLDGWHVVRSLLETSVAKRALIVALTDLAERKDRVRARENGVDLLLTRPLNSEKLMTLLDRFSSSASHSPSGLLS